MEDKNIKHITFNSEIYASVFDIRNIPEGLVANLRLKIRSSGRIASAELLKSSGNIRFDNSALQAVRRVETFNFFDSMPKTLYDKEFKIVAISFNPS